MIMFELIVGAILAALGAAASSALAKGRESEARSENYKFGEMQAENADTRTRALYTDLYSPQAQMQQIKDAGLSPSVFYGASAGSAGQSGAIANSAAITPNVFGVQSDPLSVAQIDLMKAQARKTNAEADNEEGTGAKGKAQIELWVSQTFGENAKTKYTEMQTQLAEFSLHFNEDARDFNLNKLQSEAEAAKHNGMYLMYKAKEQEQLATVSVETIQEKIKQVKLETNALKLQNALRSSAINLNEAQSQRISAEINKWQMELQQNAFHLYTEAQNAKSYNQYVNNLKQYQEDQIEQLYDRLDFDKEKFNREQKFRIAQLIISTYNENSARFLDAIFSVIGMAAKVK